MQNDCVWVSAPGDGVVGLSHTWTRCKSASGTSYVSPYVTDAAALAKEADLTLTPDRFTEFLRASAKDVAEKELDNACGHDILNPESVKQNS